MEPDKIPGLAPIVKWMGDSDMNPIPFVTTLAAALIMIGLFLFAISFGQVLSVVIFLAPLWLPVFLFLTFYWMWMDMIGNKFYLSQGRATLRIKLPQEVFKSPEAMEFVLTQVHNTASPDNYMQTYIDGKRPLPMSLEIVSIGGEVRLYVNVQRRKTKEAFEANMYAQYPGIEIVEEPVDYAAEIPFQTEEHDMMAFHMGKKNDGEIPIKSYIDYGLDRMPKEEEKNDPITPMIEVLANIKPYERVYIQIIAVSYRKQSFEMGQLFPDEPRNKKTAALIDELMRRDPKTKGPINMGGESDFEGMPRITPGERSYIELIERHAGKAPYETAIRWLYITKKGHFNGDLINPVLKTFSQYDGANAIGVRWRTDFDYKDFFPGKKLKDLNHLKEEELKLYKLRKYEERAGHSDAPKIFTAEELATMFHLPGRVALTPGLARIPSTRSEAPPNLPTGELNQ